MIVVVRRGDTLYSISRRTGVPVPVIAWLNQIPDPDVLVEGQALLILDRIPLGGLSIQVNGYAYPFISPFVLEGTLGNLNLLSSFSYGFTSAGELIGPEVPDARMLRQADDRGVRTAMVLTPMDMEGRFSNVLVNTLLANRDTQVRLLGNVERAVEETGFGEVNIDFEYILAADRQPFVAFVELAAKTLSVPVSVCLAPKTSRDQRGLLYEGKDYRAIGEAADRVLLMTYEWGYKYGPPLAVAPIYAVRRVVEYALTEIPREKISLGLPNYGYDWPEPYEPGRTVARTIGSIEAVDIARRNGTNIIFDNPSRSPWFRYTDEDGVPHVVWFEDARSWQAKFDLVKEYGLTGLGIWTVMNLNRSGMFLIGENFRG